MTFRFHGYRGGLDVFFWGKFFWGWGRDVLGNRVKTLRGGEGFSQGSGHPGDIFITHRPYIQ